MDEDLIMESMENPNEWDIGCWMASDACVLYHDQMFYTGSYTMSYIISGAYYFQ